MRSNGFFFRLQKTMKCVLAPSMAAALLILLNLGPGASAQSEYRLAQGDVLRFEVLEDANLNRSLLVAPDGRISVPLIGTVRVGGRTLEQVQGELSQRLAPNFAAPPTVFVSLERRPEPRAVQPVVPRVIEVFIMGEARNPGRLEVAPKTSVLQLFAQMGGFTNFAATKRIQLRRGNSVWSINYADIESGASNTGAIQLSDGDVIIIPQRRLFE